MKGRVHYPEEVKWKVIELKKEGYSNRTIMEILGIKNVSQIKTWMKWYRTDQTYRFQQPAGKQYPFGNGPKKLSELSRWFRCFDMCPVFGVHFKVVCFLFYLTKL